MCLPGRFLKINHNGEAIENHKVAERIKRAESLALYAAMTTMELLHFLWDKDQASWRAPWHTIPFLDHRELDSNEEEGFEFVEDYD